MNDDGSCCLFKEGRTGIGENWSEKIASELCNLLGLPHADYDLALWNDRKGVICRSFVPDGGRLVHGNEILYMLDRQYPKTGVFGVREHSLFHVLAALRLLRPLAPLGWSALPRISSGVEVFVGYLMLDAWVANQDRHHENWGIIVTGERRIYLTPTYDHASGLGAFETDTNREDRLTTRDKGRVMPKYVSKALSAFYLGYPNI